MYYRPRCVRVRLLTADRSTPPIYTSARHKAKWTDFGQHRASSTCRNRARARRPSIGPFAESVVTTAAAAGAAAPLWEARASGRARLLPPPSDE